MDRLAEQIERNGTALAAQVADDIVERVASEASAGPRGPGRALELARYASIRARGFMDEAKARIDSPDLRPFPPSPLDRGIEELERATHAWPRRDPFRMPFFGFVYALCAAFVIAGLAHLVLVTGLQLSGPGIFWLCARSARRRPARRFTTDCGVISAVITTGSARRETTSIKPWSATCAATSSSTFAAG